MKGLFGEFSTNRTIKKNPTLFEMAKERFEDAEVLNEINLFLKSCREKHLLPTRTSWEMQLGILEKIPEEKRADLVHRSTLRGYRQLAYENEEVISKKSQGKIMREGF